MRTTAATVVAAATLLSSLAGITTAGAEEIESNKTGTTADGWTPVPALKEVERGPEPGTQCESRGEVREFVKATGSHFDVEGQISSANDTDGVVPLKQQLKETKKKKWTWSTTVTIKLTQEISKKYQWEYNREMIWSMGQVVGPYDLKPGEKGTLAWGFIMDDYTSQRVRCDGSSWQSIGRQNFGSAPRERHVEARIEKM
ncbi:hypothetical protein ACUY3K_09350 [Corynebacterium uberis]|uniref:hypothetical protein n=1 Tax=Corynebacterium TaxID=1716 RepID=UPI001D09F253|nr:MULTISPECIES: hypothetical protein [Corynebacterium]MCZ9309402.1 hypothetical protein [Corynebacterium sp. c6VSa_13]UDL72952.1 hypothetical protein LH391_07460 [Corynebacterium uberis]UDL76171.1 hypothetical protein LH393_01930 [Corynebacterium uberis]UDL78383.1 hypothetical protein LH394_01925 [Corynebacterium uberis]UDL80666.1 hypothetical protein LH392_02355 [Corynebacterium uberis]